MLAFSENEIVACNAIATFGFEAVAAGRGLIALSNISYRNKTDRADFSNKIEGALRLKARDGSAWRRSNVHQRRLLVIFEERWCSGLRRTKEIVPRVARAVLLLNRQSAPYFAFCQQPFETAARSKSIELVAAVTRLQET
jgi:hypothetical protein